MQGRLAEAERFRGEGSGYSGDGPLAAAIQHGQDSIHHSHQWNDRPKLSEDDRLVLAGKKFSIDDPGRTGRCWRGVDPWLPWKKPTPADRCPFQSCFAARVRALRRSRARAFFASNTFPN